MTQSAEASLPIDVAVSMAHQLVRVIADSHTLDVVFVKGPTLTAQGIRSDPRSSADVDVLARSRVEAMLLADALSPLGWYPRPEGRIDEVFHNHAIALIHQGWPCDIDVHYDFPGIEKYHLGGFEILHSNRDTVTLETGPVPVPSATHHTVIAALNELRAPQSERSSNRLADLERYVASRTELDPTFGAKLLAAARSLGAAGTARPFLERLGLQPPDGVWPAPGAAWQTAVRSSASGTRWMFALDDAPVSRKPLLAIRALVPPQEVILGRDLYAGQQGRWSLVKSYASRLKRGLQALPDTRTQLVAYRAEKRSRKETETSS